MKLTIDQGANYVPAGRSPLTADSLMPLELDHVEAGGVRLAVNPPLCLVLFTDPEVPGYVLAEDEELKLCLAAETRDGLRAAANDDLVFAWQFYTKGDAAGLSEDARALRERLLHRLTEQR